MKAIVVEDSRLARNELVQMINDLGKFTEVIEAENGDQAVEMIKKHKPTVVFLDIHLPGMNGFEVLEQLDFVPQIIFTTAFDEYAIKSFEYNTVDYLMKPISKERLASAVDKLSPSEVGKKPLKLKEGQQVFVRDGDKCWFVKIDDIRLFESVGNYTRVYFDKEKPMILKTLNYLENILDDKKYFRANRKQIINVKFVDRIDKGFNGKLKITMFTGEQVEVSRQQSAQFQSLFGL